MLDSDLVTLYGVTTKRLNEQVRRNVKRFPADFMYQLSREEFESLKSHFATSSSWGGRRTLPYAFTEQGIAMLSSALNSARSVEQLKTGGENVSKTKKILMLIITACLIAGAGYYFYVSSIPESRTIQKEIDEMFCVKDKDLNIKYTILQYALAHAYNNENKPELAIFVLTSAIKYNREPAMTHFADVQPFSLNYELEAIYFEEMARSFELKGDVANRDMALAKSRQAKKMQDTLTRIEDEKDQKSLTLSDNARSEAGYKATFYKYAARAFELKGDINRRDAALMKSVQLRQKSSDIMVEMIKDEKAKERAELLK